MYGDGVVLTPDNRVLVDVSPVHSGSWEDHLIYRSVRLPSVQHVDGSVGVLATTGEDNYFHWVFDVLPRLALLPDGFTDLLYVARDRQFQRNYLDLLRIDPGRIVAATPESHIVARTLYVPSLPGRKWTCNSRRMFISKAVGARLSRCTDSKWATVVRRQNWGENAEDS